MKVTGTRNCTAHRGGRSLPRGLAGGGGLLVPERSTQTTQEKKWAKKIDKADIGGGDCYQNS